MSKVNQLEELASSYVVTLMNNQTYERTKVMYSAKKLIDDSEDLSDVFWNSVERKLSMAREVEQRLDIMERFNEAG